MFHLYSPYRSTGYLKQGTEPGSSVKYFLLMDWTNFDTIRYVPWPETHQGDLLPL